MYGAALIILLILLGGVIAYVGDVVGRRVGRQRLTLFGLRPKHTSVVVAVITGVIVVGTTLATLIVIDNDFREMLLDYDSVKSQLVATQGNLFSVQQELKGVQDSLSAKLKELEAKQLEIDGLQAQIEPLQQSIDRLQVEIDEKTRKNEELEKLNKDLDQTVRDLDSEVKEKEEALNAAEQNLRIAEQKFNQVNVLYNRTSEDLQTAQGELNQARAELNQVRSELDQTRSELDAKRAELEKSQSQAEELRKQRDQLEKQRDDLQKERDSLQKQRDELTRDRDSLIKERDDLIREKGDLEKQVESLRGDIESLRSQVDSLNADISALQEDKKQLNDEIERLRGEYFLLSETYSRAKESFDTQYRLLEHGAFQGDIWGIKGSLVDNWVVGPGHVDVLDQRLENLAARVREVWGRGLEVLEPDLSRARSAAAEASDKVLVRVVLAENVYASEQLTPVVKVNIQVRNRERLFLKDEVVAYAQSPIDPTESNALEIIELMAQIGQEAKKKAIDRGMYVHLDGTVGVDTGDSVNSVLRKVVELSVPVRIFLRADEDVYNTDGPIKWSFSFRLESDWQSRFGKYLE